MTTGPDPLDEALAELRFRCVPFPEGSSATGWCRAFPHDALSLHVVLDGDCHLDVEFPIWNHRLDRGAVLLVNRGVEGALRARSEVNGAPQVLSMRLELDAPHGHPLLDALPPLVQTGVQRVRAPGSFEPLFDALVAELRVPVPGRGEISRLLCEAVFIQALRMHLDGVQWTDRGWFRALADPVLRSNLVPAAVHPSTAAPVRALAASAGRSPRRFGARFGRFAGFSPSEHIQHTRARRAAKLLRDGETDLARVAHVTGYRSRQSFCRAFKREMGVTPAAYWRGIHRRRFPRRPEGLKKTRREAESAWGCPDTWEIRFALEDEGAETGSDGESGCGADPPEPE